MKEREIFDAALAIADPGERDAFLSEACGGDAGLEVHLRELLEAQRKLGSLVSGRLQGLEVATRSPSGRAATVLVRGSGGDRTVSAASVRTALGLRSTWLERVSGP